MRKKKICFDARMVQHGGIGTYIKNLLPGLKDAGYHLYPIVHPDSLTKECWLSNYDVILSKASIYSLWEQLELPILIRDSDLFFSPHYNIPLAPIRSRKRIVTIHDVCHLALSGNLRWYETLYAKQVLAQAIRRSSSVITCSQFSLSEICSRLNVSSEKINVIPYGADTQLFRKESDPIVASRVLSRYQLHGRYFVFVGNLKPHKNIRGLLLAMKLLIYEFGVHDVSLVIIGKAAGMKHTDLGHEIYDNDLELKKRVRWLSAISDAELPILYQRAEALVFPSFYEGFGLPALEAMNCGCPVIASRTASLPEVCGTAAIYVAPENPLEIATAMNHLLANTALKDALVIDGFQNAQKFTWEKTVERHIEIFEKN